MLSFFSSMERKDFNDFAGIPDTTGSVDDFREELATFLDPDEDAPVFTAKAQLIEERLGDNYGRGSEDYMERVALVDFLRGCYAYEREEYQAALPFFEASYDVFSALAEQYGGEEAGDHNRLMAFTTAMNRGNIFFMSGDKTMAHYSFGKAIEHAEYIFEPEMSTEMRQDMYPPLETMFAMVASDMREGKCSFDTASKVYRFAKEHEMQVPYTPQAIVELREEILSNESLSHIGGVWDEEDLDIVTKELEAYVEELKETEITDVPEPATVKAIELGNIYINLASIYIFSEDEEQGIAAFDQAAEFYQEAEHMNLVAEAVTLKAITLTIAGEVDAAEAAADEAMHYFYDYFSRGLIARCAIFNMKKLLEDAYVPVKHMKDNMSDFVALQEQFDEIGFDLEGDNIPKPTLIGQKTLSGFVDYNLSFYEFNPN